MRLALLVALFSAVSTAQGVHGAQYPERPVRVVVPYPAGGNPDAVARMLGTQLERQMGQPFVIDNRAGASGVIGIDIAAKAASNGYTMLFATSSIVVNQAVREKPPYDLERDLAAVTQICQGLGFVLVIHPSVRAQNLAEFIALAKQPDARIAYGSSGAANVSHMTGEMLNMKAGTHLMHVPYKGSAPALNALLGGEVQAMFVTPTIGLAPVKGGKLRAIAFTGSARWKGLPDVPAIAEVVPNFRMDAGWLGWLAPPGTPPDILRRMHAEIRLAVDSPKVRDFLIASGYEPVVNTPEQFRRFMRSEIARFREIARTANIRIE